MILKTFLSLILFLIIFSILFYPIGYFLTTKLKEKLSDFETVLLSITSSIVIFIVLAMLCGILKVRFLVLPIMAVASIYSGFIHRKKILFPLLGIFKDKIFNALAAVSLLLQGFINFPSGLRYPEGFLFWSSQGHDGLWHVALMEEARKSMPLLSPIYSGEKLVNYHYLVDVLMGEFARIFPFFSTLDLYFRFFTVIFSFLIILSVFTFVTKWQENKKIGYLAIFFTILAGSFGYIVTFIREGKFFSGETIFWAAQGNSIIGNPPHAISYSLISTSLLCLLYYFKTHKKSWFWMTFLISSLLGGFKVSGGFVFLAGMGVGCLIDFLRTKNIKSLMLVLLSGISNFAIVKFLTRGAGSFLMFEPWWFIRTMIVVPERLNMVIMEHRRQFYMAQHTWHAYLRVLQLELGGLFIFIIGNLGMKFLGIGEIYNRFIFNLKETLKKPLDMVLFVLMLTGLIMPLLFVQKGIIYNNIAFMQYFLLIFGFFAAITTYKLLIKIKKPVVKIIVVFLLVALSIPTVIGNLVDFYNHPALSKIDNAEIEALDYLKANSKAEDVVLNLPFDKYAYTKFKNQPWPIGAWYSTGYIPAVAGRRTYLSSEEQAMITGYDIEMRRDNMIKFFSETDLAWNKEFLSKNGIKYVYMTKFQKSRMEKPDAYLKTVFDNSEVVIYEVI